MNQTSTFTSPLLSICIPAYNAAPLLKRCLDSIVSQTFRDFEIIITDDSTQKETEALVTVLKQQLPIHYEYHEKGLGSPGNWNRAMELARGEWIMVLHQDDWLSHPRSLEYFMNAIEADPETFFVFGKIEPDEKPEIVKKIPGQIPLLKTEPELILMQNIIGPPSNVIFRNIGHRFDTNLFWVVDFEMYFSWLKENRKYQYIPSKLVEIGKHDEQITAFCDRNPDIKLKENAYLLTKHKKQVKMSIRLYDYFWRQVRNTALLVPHKMQELEKGFPGFMLHQWKAQQNLSQTLLKKGWYSKLMMIFSWMKEQTRK